MDDDRPRLTVYYDGACPRCVRDRARYERLSGESGADVCWVDISGRDAELEALGIAPRAALTELHVADAQGRVHREMDAYIVLMRRVPRLRPVAWLIGQPGVRHALSWLYRHWVRGRLRREGRL